MENPTQGLVLHTRRRWLDDTVELLSSMRFAISLLVMIAIAAVIGTIMKQNEPLPNYINQFGPFWYEVFARLGLYAVYSAWWFILMMGFLVLSTSLCIVRNAPKMLKDMRSWRENVREQSLRNFHHHFEWDASATRQQLLAQVQTQLSQLGYRSKVVEKEGGTLLAAKQGTANKWGYIFAHSAIVIICIGASLDSEMPIRLQQWLMGKVPFEGNGIIAQIPEKHRLPLANPSFRGNTMIPEGASSDTAILPQQTGVLIQDLPFTIQLKKFVIDYYTTGMPKLFASEVVIKDHATGETFPATIKVNQPLIYHGIAIYQSSFEDGGSHLQLLAYPMSGAQTATHEIRGDVGGSQRLNEDYTIEWSGFRATNVENMAGADVRAVNQKQSFDQQFSTDLNKHLGSAAKNANNKELRNVGPSVQYRLRDKTGQAREFSNYMVPMDIDGERMFLSGTRDNPGDAFRYLRIPADDEDSLNEWMRLRAALANPTLHETAAHRYADLALPKNAANADRMREQLVESARKSMAIFAGNGGPAGYMAVSQFLEKIPAAEQEKAADVFMKILNGSLWELWQAAREKDGLPAMPMDDKHARFLQLAINALSDAGFYGAPVYLRLTNFEEVKASVLQVTRSPGKKIVYLGCLLLVLGVFSMFYIRERRLWVWIKDQGTGSSALLALSSQRKTLDFEKEFETLRQRWGQTPQQQV